MGQSWYQSTAYDLPLFRWIFFLNLKGLPSLKSVNVFSALLMPLSGQARLVQTNQNVALHINGH
jgi:hypothetical protein